MLFFYGSFWIIIILCPALIIITSQMMQIGMRKDKGTMGLLLGLLAYRIICALLTRNYEYPDQYWQGNEVAHHIHYGYGHLTWQWTIPEPIRNPVYPFLLSLSYYLPEMLNLPFHALAPKFLIQVPIAVVADYYVLRILWFLYGRISGMMLLCVFANWYYAGTMVRTYFNSFETMAVVVAGYYWLISGRIGLNNWQDALSRLVVIVSYVSRPTSIMMWALLWPYELIQISRIHGPFSKASIKFILKNILTILIMVMGSFVVGSLYNGKPILTELNFIKYNFVQKWSQLYGREPFYYYFIISVPFMANTGLLLLAISLLSLAIPQNKYIKDQKPKNKEIKILIVLSIAYLLISSLSTHKEHRFIFPIIPIILIISAHCLRQGQTYHLVSKRVVKFIGCFTVLLNGLIFVQFEFWGKADGVQAWGYIDERIRDMAVPDSNISVVVLGQSHFMPGYSSLHRNISYRIPDSSAPTMSLNSSQNTLLRTAPHKLYSKLTTGLNPISPTFIIAQGKYLQYTANLLAEAGYSQMRSWRHCTLFQESFIGYDSISVFSRPVGG